MQEELCLIGSREKIIQWKHLIKLKFIIFNNIIWWNCIKYTKLIINPKFLKEKAKNLKT